MAARNDKYLTFTLGKEIFAINIQAVREIQDLSETTRIPLAPDYMRGVVNLRGNAVPVLDLKQRLGLERTERTINTRIIIIEKKDGSVVTLVGAIADSVKEVIEIDKEHISPPPKMGASVSSEYLQGIARLDNNFILIMDVIRVFSNEELAELTTVAQDISQAETTV